MVIALKGRLSSRNGEDEHGRRQNEGFVGDMEERDHRKIGQELDLFTFSELVGPGLPFGHRRAL
jgi:threonyl-tRNA synthetase